MINDSLKEGQENDDIRKPDAKKGSESRLEVASDFKLDSHKNTEKSSFEARETKEHGRNDSAVHYQEKRLENASDFDELKETREKKAEISEAMVSKDFPLSSEKRLDNAKDFHYVNGQDFGDELAKRDHSTTEQDKELTRGFHDGRDNQAFVKDKGDTLKTSIHEKLHQKSMSELPTRLNEGITEYYARERAGAMGALKDIDHSGKENLKPLSDYEREVEIVSKLESTIGKEPLSAAYFGGDKGELMRHTDSVLGDGSFEKITNALEARDYKSASDIIENYYKKQRGA